MNTLRFITCCSATLFAVLSAQGQDTFQNLNFELANPVFVGDPYDPGLATATSALPFWSISYGNVQQTEIDYNEPSAGSTAVTLIGPGNPIGVFGPITPIDGNYSVLLQGGVTAASASISQTGQIPAGTQYLLFEAQSGPGPLDILIGSQNIPFTAVGTGPNYTLYSGNVSAWAGDTEQLTISAVEGFGGGNSWLVDDISFSPTGIPEPSIVALSAIGGLLFGARKWFARR